MSKKLMVSLVVAIIFVLFALSATAAASTYEVRRGDSLWRIAHNNSITVSDLMSANNLTSSLIRPGQVLTIPGSAGSQTEANPEESSQSEANPEETTATYEVRRGDSLWGIAHNNSITVSDLMSANNLTSSLIHPGQVLTIPGSAGSQTEAGQSDGQLTSRQKTVNRGEYLDWAQARNIYTRGTIATVTDVSTGLSFKVKRRGGTNHADTEPLTAADTATMKRVYGGSWSWTPRAIIVSVGGRHIAASMNGMPHGGQFIHNNNFPGHICIHFKNSRTHNNNSISPTHQAAVRRAAGL